jgi:hypothetical protein
MLESFKDDPLERAIREVFQPIECDFGPELMICRSTHNAWNVDLQLVISVVRSVGVVDELVGGILTFNASQLIILIQFQRNKQLAWRTRLLSMLNVREGLYFRLE